MKRDFKGILEYLKLHIMVKLGVEVVKPGVVADELGVEKGLFAVWTHRGFISYEVILDYCLAEGLDPLEVFYKK